MPRTTTWSVMLLAALIGVLAIALHAGSPAGAGGAAGPVLTLVPHSEVGRVEGTRAYIALSFEGRRLRAYVCDGTAGRRATISQWFQSRWDGRSPLTLVRNGIELKIDRVHGNGVSGRLRAFSGPHPFRVRPAAGPAGLYDGTDSRKSVRATWIVLADRSTRGTMVPTRPPRRVCRVVTVALADGTTQERVTCYDV